MSFEKKMKDRGNEKLNQYSSNPYLKSEKQSGGFFSKIPLWTKITVPSAIVTVGVVLAITLTSTRNNNFFNPNSVDLNSISLTSPNKVFNKPKQNLSADYINAINNFASDFYDLALEDNPNQNVVFSPLSLATCFSMAFDGATGETRNELAKAFYLNDGLYNHQNEIQKMLDATSVNIEKYNEYNSKNAYSNVSEAIFIDDSFKIFLKETYLKTLEDYYYAEAYHGQLDSDNMHQALADYINDKTNDFFSLKKDDFEQLAGVLWLVNTIYLKANWGVEFYELDNGKITFNNLDGTTSNSLSYISTSFEKEIIESTDYYIANIPLIGGFRFSILLPKDAEQSETILKNSVSDLLNQDSLEGKYKADLTINLPTFKARTKYNLVVDKYLARLGITRATDKKIAEFDNIANLPSNMRLYIKDAIHEAGVNVSKEGVEAAAYTIVAYDATSAMPEPLPVVQLDVDRPFLYSISTYDGLNLFVGEISKL